MNKEIKVFENEEFGEVRTLLINDEPYFVGKDVASALGYKDTKDAISKHVDLEDKTIIQRGQFTSLEIPNRGLTVINESGLYSLILSSKLPTAKKFKRWVTSEVLPSIRKHGAYMTDEVVERTLTDPDYIIQIATRMKEERQARLKAEKERNKLIHTDKTYTTSEIAKELGFKSPQAFNNVLKDMNIIYKRNKTWLPKAAYADKGYMEIKQEILPTGYVVYDSRWTGKGRDFLLNLFNRNEEDM